MRVVKSLLPLAVGLVIVGGLVGVLISREVVLGEWLLAALLVGHGWVHVMFVSPRPQASAVTAGGPEWPFDIGRSWLIGAGLGPGLVRSIAVVLTAMVLVAFTLAALSTVGLLVPADWWPALILAGAGTSLALLGLVFSPMLLLGVAIDLVLLWVVLASVWIP
jgi:hypothetical protein